MGCLVPSCCEPCCRVIGCSCQESELTLEVDKEKRVCTDLPFLLGFFITIGVCGYLYWYPAYKDGNPDSIIRGVDYLDRICGISEGVELKPLAFFPVFTDPQFKICVGNCTETETYPMPLTLINYKSIPKFDKYCIPDPEVLASLSTATSDLLPDNIFQEYMSAVQKGLWIIAASVPVSAVIALVYITLMKIFLKPLIYISIIAIIALGAFIAYEFWDRSQEVGISKTDKNIRLGICGGSAGFTVIFGLIMYALRNKIKIAIEIIKSAGRAIQDMKGMIIFPVFPLIVKTGYIIAWIYASIYMFSVSIKETKNVPDAFSGQTIGGITYPTTYKALDYDTTIRTTFPLHFFILLWGLQIILYFSYHALCGAICEWYFTRRNENGRKIRGSGQYELGRLPIIRSTFRAFFYHLGSIMFGALIIAIIQFIRYIIHYIEYAGTSKKPNPIQKYLLKCAQFCLWCLECCLDKISKNAFIWQAITGDPFLPSACGSFKLIWSNLISMSVITLFGKIATFVGKIFIPVATTAALAAVIIFVEPYKTDIESPVAPLIIIFIISFFIASLFVGIFSTSIDTVFLCFLMDKKVNGQNGKMFADEQLKNCVQKYDKMAKKKR